MSKKIGIVATFGSRGFGFLHPESTDANESAKRLFFHVAEPFGGLVVPFRAHGPPYHRPRTYFLPERKR
jgi:hypothetical protein